MAPAAAIRLPRTGDAPALIAYLKTILAETPFLALEPWELRISEAQEEAFIDRMNETDNTLMLVAEEEDAVVGVLTVEGRRSARFRHNGECGVSVLRSHWGRGIGSALMEEMLEWAAENPQVLRLSARIREGNDRSVRLFEKFGFRHEGRLAREMKVGDRFYDSLLLAREV